MKMDWFLFYFGIGLAAMVFVAAVVIW